MTKTLFQATAQDQQARVTCYTETGIVHHDRGENRIISLPSLNDIIDSLTPEERARVSACLDRAKAKGFGDDSTIEAFATELFFDRLFPYACADIANDIYFRPEFGYVPLYQ